MDETIAHLQSVYYFIASLTLKSKDLQYRSTYFTDGFELYLDKAYQLFVKYILKEEASVAPLGILRPGILDVMRQLWELKKQGKVLTVIIYSNNSHLESLYFIKDLIHAHVGTKRLIRECIHWFHPMRNIDKILYKESRGSISKSWDSLRHIMVNGSIKAPTGIDPADVHFFDDLDHMNLRTMLQANYHKVPAYTFKASFDRISILFLKALRDSNIHIEQLSLYLYELYGEDSVKKNLSPDNLSLIEDVLDIFKFNTGPTAAVLDIPPRDDGIDIIENVIEDVKQGMKLGQLRKKKHRTYKKRRWTMRNTK